MRSIIGMVGDIMDRGYGYATGDGSVYFRVRSVPDYGILSNRTLEQMRSSGRIEQAPGKEDPLDFAIWKGAKPGEVAWDSPWGRGRPGWHIECSAMIRDILGDEIDIHGGGNDLVFPHHENEILQTEACTGGHLAHYWMHNGMLEIRGGDGKAVKMSKSLNNFFSVKDVARQFDRQTIRFYYLNTHYRSPLTYGEENLLEAQSALRRIWNSLADLEAVSRSGPEGPAGEGAEAAERAFAAFRGSMDDDFNTRQAIESVFALVRAANRLMSSGSLTRRGADAVIDTLRREDEVLGILPDEDTSADIGPLMDLITDLRTELRSRRMYDLADTIRDRLRDAGYAIEDGRDGAVWKKLRPRTPPRRGESAVSGRRSSSVPWEMGVSSSVTWLTSSLALFTKSALRSSHLYSHVSQYLPWQGSDIMVMSMSDPVSRMI